MLGCGIGRRGWFLRAGGVAVLVGVLGAAAVAEVPPATGGLVKSGDAPSLELVYTGDVIGYLDPCG
jgi:hypothetical protein